jgi:hypothetical protein
MDIGHLSEYSSRQEPRLPPSRGLRRPGVSALAFILLLASPLVAWADPAREVAALEAKCEQDREAKIKPLREAQIARCKADTRNDPQHCEHFWSDYGNGGRRRPRLFDNLPSCVAAATARKALRADDD